MRMTAETIAMRNFAETTAVDGTSSSNATEISASLQPKNAMDVDIAATAATRRRSYARSTAAATPIYSNATMENAYASGISVLSAAAKMGAGRTTVEAPESRRTRAFLHLPSL